jgi:hypothetical protein
MSVFPAHSSETRATLHASQLDTRSHPPPLAVGRSSTGNEDRDTEGATACNPAPPSANARSLFVQLSNVDGGADAAKAALERTATPIVPRSAGAPSDAPGSAGSGQHRTRSSSGAPPCPSNRLMAHSLTPPPFLAYRNNIGHAVRFLLHSVKFAWTSSRFYPQTRPACSSSRGF